MWYVGLIIFLVLAAVFCVAYFVCLRRRQNRLQTNGPQVPQLTQLTRLTVQNNTSSHRYYSEMDDF